MHAATEWLNRLRQEKPEDLRVYPLPILTPGIECLELENCIISTEPKGVLPPRSGDSSPVCIGILRYVDLAHDINLQRQEDLIGELNALISLVTERRISVPKVLALTAPGAPEVSFLGYGASVDRRLHGTISQGIEPSIHQILSQVAGLPERIRPIIGAAIQLHHAAIELYEVDLRAAYLLLVAGIELLSREFGNPPKMWGNWEGSEKWEKTFDPAGLSVAHRGAIRKGLMEDRQLRLKASFREYGSTRVPDSFWDEIWMNWIYGYDATSGAWLEGRVTEKTIRQILPHDRQLLSRLLG